MTGKPVLIFSNVQFPTPEHELEQALGIWLQKPSVPQVAKGPHTEMALEPVHAVPVSRLDDMSDDDDDISATAL